MCQTVKQPECWQFLQWIPPLPSRSVQNNSGSSREGQLGVMLLLMGTWKLWLHTVSNGALFKLAQYLGRPPVQTFENTFLSEMTWLPMWVSFIRIKVMEIKIDLFIPENESPSLLYIARPCHCHTNHSILCQPSVTMVKKMKIYFVMKRTTTPLVYCTLLHCSTMEDDSM